MSPERENDLTSLRLASIVGSVDSIISYRRDRMKARPPDLEAVAVIDDVCRLRHVVLDAAKERRLIHRMMAL